MDGGAFIRELCIALEHRWKPEELFLLFTAYFDEADTHGRAPHMVMAALLGQARQWELFRRRLGTMQRTERFSIFHATEFKASTGEFKGWDDTKGAGLIHSLAELVRDTLTEGVTAHLEHERYIKEYRQSYTPKGIALDSQYGLCFRMILAHLLSILMETGNKHKLHIVVERGHRNALNTERIFNEIKETQKTRGVEILGDWTLAKKEEAAPLMVADFLAHSFAMMKRPGGMGIQGYAEVTPEPNKGEAGLTFLELGPNSLPELKLQMQRDHLARRAYNRSQKAAATLTASVSSAQKGA
jgi:hypothetical protein